MEEGICPIAGLNNGHMCEERCAWYDRNNKMCAIYMIAQGVFK